MGFMEEWRPIDGFEGYHVSSHGLVLNKKTGRIMRLGINQRGIVYVGLMKNRVQYKRSVALLVAKRFISSPPNEAFDSVINLDGDRTNNFATNLAWRPEWFAKKYNRQFAYQHRVVDWPIVDMDTGEEYANIWDAALVNGLLVTSVALSLDDQEPVWPTKQRFQRRS